MERDRELEHYEWLGGCNDDGFEPEQEAETAAQQDAQKFNDLLSATGQTTAGVESGGRSVRPFDSAPRSSGSEAQQVADDAALRVARSSWANTKLLMKAMGCE